MRKSKIVILVLVCVLLSGAVGFGGGYLASHNVGTTSSSSSISSDNTSLDQATGSKLSTQEIIAKNANSVVEITTESVTTDFWMQEYITEGAGSGVIIDGDGYILTNNHVIEGANKIKVKLHNGSEYKASLVATDSRLDVAVIKISAKSLTPATFGDSSKLTVGDLAIAIGNPLGQLGGTATCGIISSLDRELTIDGQVMALLQTDASINPGNSGGGLFDQYGNLIGLVVAKSSGSDVEGLGFAIPSNTVKKAYEDLRNGGKVEGRPAIGITVNYVDADSAIEEGYRYAGVYIYEVAGKNAKKSGLKAGDYIYYIDNVQIETTEDLQAEVGKHEVGDVISIVVVRDGKTIETTVKLVDASSL